MSVPRPQFDHLALEQLDALYRMARRLTRDPTRAEDLVQETFARALRSRESFSLQEFGIKPWLLRIMYNLHLNRADRDKRQPISKPPRRMAMPFCQSTRLVSRRWMSSWCMPWTICLKIIGP
jgi:RNA polymerase sigma factor (sigma-70 family)